jgi:PAS domain S-box-containing protein
MDIDYRLAFDLAPVGLALSRNRSIMDCNQHLCDMFGTTRERLIGQSFQVLYPSADEFERTGARIGPILNRNGTYADDRIMRRVDGRFKGRSILVPRDGPRTEPRSPARGRHLEF